VTGWRDQLRPASWRGLACFVEDATASGGRRLAVHEYPLRDEPYPEDMGRRQRRWQVVAYLLGSDVLTLARAFADALERGGAGVWTDPWRGEVDAVVDTYEWGQSSKEGGVARFQIAFLEAGEAAYPTLEADHAAATAAAAAAAAAGARAAFVRGFSVSGLAEAALDDAAAVVGVAAADIKAAAGTVVATASQAAQWARAALMLAADARALVETPSLLADRMLVLLGSERLAGMTWRQWLAIADWAPRLKALGTAPQAAAMTTRRAALAALVRRAGVIGAARAAATGNFATYDEAIEARTALATRLDDVASGADAAEHASIMRLRGAVVRAVSDAAPRLPRLRTLDFSGWRPALAVAWGVYGGEPASVLGRADEIVARNRTPHPLFAASPLQVLVAGGAGITNDAGGTPYG